MLVAELESVAHAPLDDGGRRQRPALARALGLQPRAHPVHRRAGDARGRHRSLLEAIAAGAPFETRLATPVAAIAQRDERVEVHTRGGEMLAARGVVVAVPLNTLGADRVRPAAVRAQAGGDRARPGLARDQDLHPRARSAGAAEHDPARASVRLPRHRVAARGRDADHDRLRDRRSALDAADLRGRAARARRDHPRLRRCSTRPPTTGSRTSSRSEPGRSTGPAGTRATTPRCAAPRAACCSPAPTSPTAGPGSSTGRSSRAPRRRVGGCARRAVAERPPRGRIVEATLRGDQPWRAERPPTRRRRRGRRALASTTYHFASKDAIVQEALELVIDARSRRRRTTAPPGPTSPAGLVEPAGAAHRGLARRPRRRWSAQYELMIEAGRRPQLRPLAERWERAYLGGLRGPSSPRPASAIRARRRNPPERPDRGGAAGAGAYSAGRVRRDDAAPRIARVVAGLATT